MDRVRELNIDWVSIGWWLSGDWVWIGQGNWVVIEYGSGKGIEY